MKIDLNNREFLWKLEEEASKHKDVTGVNPRWKSVYRRLAEVVCELDAYIARTEHKMKKNEMNYTKIQKRVWKMWEMAYDMENEIQEVGKDYIFIKYPIKNLAIEICDDLEKLKGKEK